MEIVKWIFKLGIRSSYVISLVVAFLFGFTFTVGLLTVVTNNDVLLDLMALMQSVLPFNLNVVYAWVFTILSIVTTIEILMFINRRIKDLTD